MIRKIKTLLMSSVIGLFSLGVIGLTQLPAYAAQSTDFSYTGSVQQFTVPVSGTYELQVWGAQGGNSASYTGGNGGYSQENVNLTTGQTLYVYVGNQGQSDNRSNSGLYTWKNGGYNGGGNSYSDGGSGAGGGATDISTVQNVLSSLSSNQSSVLIVAGAGGGAGWESNGFYGGGSQGGSFSGTIDGSSYYGGGGSQSSGGGNAPQFYSPYNYPVTSGGFGYGGNGMGWSSGGGGGGAGWYGGGGSGFAGGSGGGSGYVSVANGQTIAGNQSMPSPTGGTETGQSGNGYAIITQLYAPPSLSLSPSTTNWTNAGVTITASATANQPGSSISWIELPNGNYVYSASASYTVYSNGTYTFTTDDSGGYTTQKSITVNQIDTTAPSAPTISLSTTNWTNGNVTFTLGGSSDGQSGVSYYQYQIDGGAWTTYSGTVTVSGDGKHTINARAVDVAGNVSSTATNYAYIDTSAPTMSHSLSPSGWTNGGVTISESASDNESGVSRIVLPNGSTQYSTSASETVNTDGTYTFYSYDNAGNENSDAVIVNNIDTTAPVLSLSENTTVKTTNNITITASASDSQSGVNAIELPNGNWINGSSASYAVSSNGNYTFYAKDNAGNTTNQTIDVTNILPPNNTVPDLVSVTNKGNSAFVQWGVSMPPQNVLYSTSFEPGQTFPNLQGGGNSSYGNQSFSSSVGNGDNYSMELQNNINPVEGNGWWYPSTSSTTSANYWSGVSIPNGTNLSVTFDVKAVNGSTSSVSVYNGAPWGEAGVPIYDNNGHQIFYSQQVNWAYPPYSFSVYTNNGAVNLNNGQPYELVTSTNGNHDYGQMWYIWNQSSQEFVRDPVNTEPWAGSSPLGTQYYVTTSTFNEGDPLLQNYWASIYFGTINVPIDNQWHTVSFNAKASDSNYNFQTDGFDMRWFWSTDGTMYIDNVKVGYATQVQLFRDGQQIPLTTAQSYLSSFTDSGATDKAPPSAPTNVTASENGDTVHLTWNSSTDYGTTYQYYLKSVDANGVVSAQSNTMSVDVVSGVNKYNVYANGTLVGSTTGTSLDIPSNDFNNITIVAVDNAGNTSSATVVPTMTVTQYPTTWTSGNVTLTATASDSNGITSIELPNGNTVNANSATYSVTNNGDETFTAYDTNGNQVAVTTNVTNMDSTVPNIDVSPNTTNWTNQPVTLSVSALDSESGVNKILLPNNNTQGLNQTYYTVPALSTSATPPDYGSSPVNSVSQNINQSWTPNGTQGWVINWTGYVKSPVSGTVNFQTLTDDGNRLWVDGNLLINQWNPQGATPYNGSINMQAGVWYPIRMEYYENGYGAASAQLNWEYPGMTNYTVIPSSDFITGSWISGTNTSMQVSQNGTYRFLVSDKAGNISTQTIQVSNIDMIPPSLTLSSSNSHWTNGNITITASAADGQSGINYIELPDGSSVHANTATFTASTSGTYSFTVYDNAGNATTQSITISNIDKTPPSLTVTETPTTWTAGQVILNVSATDANSGVATIQLPNGSVVNNSNTSYVVTTNGTYTFVATDVAGNTTTKSVTVSNVDTTPPTTPSISNDENWTNAASVSVSITGGTDSQSGVAETQYELSGASNQGWTTYTSPFAVTNEGITTITARTIDNVGNVSATATSVVKIDRTAPTNDSITIVPIPLNETP